MKTTKQDEINCPEIGSRFVHRVSGDLVVVTDQPRIVEYRFLSGHMIGKLGSAGLGEFYTFFDEENM